MMDSEQWEGIIATYVQFESDEGLVFTRLFVFSDKLVEGLIDNQLETQIKKLLFTKFNRIKKIFNVCVIDEGLIYKTETPHIIH